MCEAGMTSRPWPAGTIICKIDFDINTTGKQRSRAYACQPAKPKLAIGLGEVESINQLSCGMRIPPCTAGDSNPLQYWLQALVGSNVLQYQADLCDLDYKTQKLSVRKGFRQHNACSS
jgi:hypothetical protein